MPETINWFAVAVAAFATFVVGGPWYGLLGKRWQRAMGITQPERGHPVRVFGLAYVFSFIAAGCLAALLGPEATAQSGLIVGATVGACIVAASFGVNYVFANRSLVALLIDGGYHIVQFAVFGFVLGAWPR